MGMEWDSLYTYSYPQTQWKCVHQTKIDATGAHTSGEAEQEQTPLLQRCGPATELR